MTPTIDDAIAAAAATHRIDPAILTALVQVESGGQPFAWNPEPRYQYLWDVRHGRPFRAITAAEGASEIPPPDFPCLAGDADQEWWAQQASWGLCQLMGAVAREHGCRVPYLPALGDPFLNLTLGASHLAELLAWAQRDVRRALGAYNAGKGRATSTAGVAYANRVLLAMGT